VSRSWALSVRISIVSEVYSGPKEGVTRSESSSEKNLQARSVYKEGFSLFVQGKIDEAIARYRDALAIDASLSIAWNGLSVALAKQGDLETAIEAAEKLVELEPDDPLSHTNLSRILMQKGLIPEAEDAKARAMGLQMRQSN
jgi:tetratricopeptide (TPR) repeat protein